MKNILHTSNIKSLKKIYQGKVRDIYEVDENNILIISTDRVSVFDVVLPTPIPEKGIILNKVSNFWFKKFEGLVENHLSNINIQDLKISDDEYEQIEGRSVIVKKLKALPIESIVRSYLIGSGYSDYLSKGSICDIELPKDMKMASKLPNIIFTPSTKAEIGNHDININFTEMKKLIGDKISKAVKDVSVKIFREAEDFLSNKPEKKRFKLIMENYICDNYIYIADNPEKDFIAPNYLGWRTICLNNKGQNIHNQNKRKLNNFQSPDVWIDCLTELTEHLI